MVFTQWPCLKLALTDWKQSLFAITPLNWVEWKAVLYLSAPVLAIDEVLKFISVSRFYAALVVTSLVLPQATFIDPPSKIKVQ
jgi:Ca2+ transporting ATPase